VELRGWRGGGEVSQDLVTYKSHTGRGGSHGHCLNPCSPDSPHIYWDFKAVVDFVKKNLRQASFPLLRSYLVHLLFELICSAEMSVNLGMLCLCLCFCWTEARIWAWMLNMPHSPPKAGAKALRESTPVAKAAAVRPGHCARGSDSSCVPSQRRKARRYSYGKRAVGAFAHGSKSPRSFMFLIVLMTPCLSSSPGRVRPWQGLWTGFLLRSTLRPLRPSARGGPLLSEGRPVCPRTQLHVREMPPQHLQRARGWEGTFKS